VTATLHIALLGNPNCGKTALFNLLTGSRQKVANYPGVTVERKDGMLTTASGKRVRVLDLPGAYSLNPVSADEEITHDIVLGRHAGEKKPELIVCVTDATNLKLNLRLVIEVKRLGLPLVLALNLTDVARRRGIRIDRALLERELGVPVVETVAVRRDGARALLERLDALVLPRAPKSVHWSAPNVDDVLSAQREVRRIFAAAVQEPPAEMRVDDAIDRVVLHPLWGMAVLAATLFLMFQAVFSWAQVPMDAIKAGMDSLRDLARVGLAPGMLQSLLADGIIAGAGSVLVFLPQILILFLFILVLEDCGYLPRAAFLLDRTMSTVGLSGRSFIPLLSSFACAIPGVMATRTISNWRDRVVTIMIAPLMTCSARLPVYALIIGAFVPNLTVWRVFNLQGLVLFVLFVTGVIAAMCVAWAFKRLRRKALRQPLLLELPSYRWPDLRSLVLGLIERARIFVERVGTIILALMVLLWFISSFPSPPAGASGTAIQYSLAGIAGRWLEAVFAPIGFNWQISIALIPGLAAREVAVGALGTVYALSATGENLAEQLGPMIAQSWSLATAFSLLAWYVFAPQCLATLATVRRETNSWRYPLFMAAYLFGLAYLASFATFHAVLFLMGD
jgi:ferrous iron transport protein B